jgi:2-oxoglutarate dehydrogenase E1 component
MTSISEFHGPNSAYVLDLYERYQQEPDSVDPVTRQYFEQWSPQLANGVTETETTDSTAVDMHKAVGVANYAQAIRQFGHLAAQLNPLGYPPPGDPDVLPEAHGITEQELHNMPASFVGEGFSHLRSAFHAVQSLKDIYCSSIGYDFEQVHEPTERQWLREAIESRRYAVQFSNEENIALLDRLTQIETFELFLQRSFPTKYRFSIEGLDMMVPMLDELVKSSVTSKITNVAIGMAHRGRLNVLAHIMGKEYQDILADFKDPLKLQEVSHAIGWTIGDVKYHKGVERTVTATNGETSVTVTMPPNPSHLEVISPVAVGMARAIGTDVSQRGESVFHPDITLQILIHGDASFSGQGIVAETFNLSRLPGYWTGGTVHIIANNQIGFTTLPRDNRSTLYASDLAKGFRVPVIHVNADDPLACMEVARIAFGYQDAFEKDFMIDLIGYRRYGHNELDEPSFTQPLMYKDIRPHKTVRKLWSQKLIDDSITTNEATSQLVNKYNEQLQKILDESLDGDPADSVPPKPAKGVAATTDTSVDIKRLLDINDAIEDAFEGFNFYSTRFKRTILSRRDMSDPKAKSIDWAGAEEFALASILEDGISIRMTGQDIERGTFSHRHAVLHDAKSGETLAPLQVIKQAQAAFSIHNSPLSEEAALGFEYGYNVAAPERLVIWEAQYGDFVNGAQNIIDEFILSAREKWGLTPSLVMLLPHGHEGAGPDHSSARPERFLSMAARTNVRIANVTSSAQYYHLLRRQALLLKTDPLPLVIMSPKSLLRNPNVASSLHDLANGRFAPVIDDNVDPDQVDRIVFVSGKFYFDLINSEWREQYPNVAVVRVEQLYSFPAKELGDVVKRYKQVKQVVWAQEEPKNMGVWDFINYRLKKLVGRDLPVNYVGRRRSSSPAEGSKTAHNVNQSMICEYAFNWKFE